MMNLLSTLFGAKDAQGFHWMAGLSPSHQMKFRDFLLAVCTESLGMSVLAAQEKVNETFEIMAKENGRIVIGLLFGSTQSVQYWRELVEESIKTIEEEEKL